MDEKRLLARYRDVPTVVLGPSGFIGRWVARGLGAEGAKVYLFVRNRALAERVFSSYDVRGEIVEIDLLNFDALYELFDQIRPTITFNLAAYGIEPAERDEGIAGRTNAQLLAALAAAVANTRDPLWSGQNVVHAGSAQEYGAIACNLAEDSTPNPTTVYGRSKLAGTNLLLERCTEYGLKGVTARLFTVYGPGEHAGRLLPALLDTARTGKPLPLTAGTQARDFTYVEDVAEGLLRLGLAPARPGAIVNLATGTLTSVREFVGTAAQVLQIPAIRLGFGLLPTRSEEMEHSAVSIERLKHWVGWVPSTTILEGIARTVAFERTAPVASP